MKAKIYVGAKKYALYIGRKIVQKTLEFLTLPARFISKKVQDLKQYLMYGQSVQSNLPEGYTQLESLSSTGYEYINTGLIIQEGDEIQLDYEWLGNTPSTLSADMIFFGCQNVNTSIGGVWVELYRREASALPTWYARFSGTGSNSSTASELHITGRHLLNINQQRVTIDGSQIIVLTSSTGTFQETPLTLFGRLNSTGTQLNSSKLKVFGLKVINNGIERLNLVPCKNSDNILGMYDTVTDTFLTNQGTGEFIAGDVTQPTPTNPIEVESVGDNETSLPLGYTQLEYIENGSNTFIDTEVIPALLNNEYYVRFECGTISSLYLFQSSGSDSRIFGITGSSTGSTIAGSTGATITSTISRIIGNTYTINYIVDESGNRTLKVVDETTSNSDIKTGTPYTTSEAKSPLCVFGNRKGDRLSSGTKIYELWYKENDEYVIKFVPAKRNSDNVIGFYDVARSKFYPANDGVLIAGNEVGQGGYKVPVVVGGKNLFNKDGEITNWYSSARVITTASSNRTFAIRHVPGTEYYYKHCNVAGGGRRFYTNAENPEIGSEASIMYGTTIIQPNQVVHVQDVPDDAKWVFFNAGRTGQTAKVQEQLDDFMVTTTPIDEDTPYIPYVQPTTTNIYLDEPLRKIGEYADYIDFENQKVVRNVEKSRLLDLNFSKHPSYENIYRSGTINNVPNINPIAVSYDSKKYTPAKSIGSMDDNYCIKAHVSSTGLLYISDNIHNTKEEFDNFLETIDDTVYYPLTTPIEQSITLPAISLPQGTVTIDTDTNVKPSKIIITGDIDNE